MLLNELFGSPEEINWILDGPRIFKGYFKIGDVEFLTLLRVGKTSMLEKLMDRVVEVTGTEREKEQAKRTFDMFKEKGMDSHINVLFEDTEKGYKVTGRGNASAVIGTAMAGIKYVVNKTGVKVLSFGADEKSRRKLYDRLVKMMGNDYSFSTTTHTGAKLYVMVID